MDCAKSDTSSRILLAADIPSEIFGKLFIAYETANHATLKISKTLKNVSKNDG